MGLYRDTHAAQLLMQRALEESDPELMQRALVTALEYAVDSVSHDTVQSILSLGVIPVDSRHRGGATALHLAAEHSSAAIVSLLICHKSDIESRRNDGKTPLLVAAAKGRMDCLLALLRDGAEPLVRDHKDRGALDLAIGHHHDEVATFLLTHHPSIAPTEEGLDKTFVQAVRNGLPQTVSKLAELGADIGQKPGGRTLAQIAPRHNTELMRVLKSLKVAATIDKAMDAGPVPISTASRTTPTL